MPIGLDYSGLFLFSAINGKIRQSIDKTIKISINKKKIHFKIQ